MGLKLKSTGGTGSVQLNAPASHNTDTTITLPADNVTGGQFVLADGSGDVNIDSGTLYVDASTDRVGIGSTSPAERLEVKDTVNDVTLQISATNTGKWANLYLVGNTTENYLTSNQELSFYISGSERARIESDGDFTLGSTTNYAFIRPWSTTTGNMIIAADQSATGTGGSAIEFKSRGTERMRLYSNGGVALGTINNTASSIDVNTRVYYHADSGSTSGTVFIDSRNSGGFVVINQSYGDNGNRGAVEFYRNESYKGQISVSSTQVYYNETSDYRLKENVADASGCLDLVKQLQPRTFNFISEPSETITGFIAHEVQAVVPNAITGEKDAVKIWEEGDEIPDGVSVGDNKLDENGDTIPVYQCIDQAKLVPVLTAALKEAIAKIETLEANNVSLEAKVTALETQNASFEARLAALEGGTTE